MVAVTTAKKTTIDVASPIEARKPTPVRTSASMASTTVPPAKTTAAPDEPIADDSAGRLSWPAVRFSR